jgi:predicted flap endonuclease-1-like 5' DNA nuclease
VINPDKNVMGERIITDDRKTDDLTRIEHIGSFVQDKLHQIGVFTYEDIAAWDPARIAQVTSLIGYLPGRIEKDNWVGQAAALAAADDDDTQARGFSAATPDHDDLKIIEGVGPKIEQVLKESGVFNLNQLAERDPEELRSMLIQAGDKYRMHNPDSWPKQAELAAAGKMEELQEYQEKLKGGRESES